jgi:nucleotide-binding universal stress UspA family protein
MNRGYKILIAHDGSDCADAALDDLRRAGLPREAEAVVMSVAELWLPPPSSYEVLQPPPPERPPGGEEEALTWAQVAAAQVLTYFPTWEVRAEAHSGSPARKIIQQADHWQPDLIVVGSHGRTTLGRLFLGSVSQKVVAEAGCSVRVARGRLEESDAPARLVIGVDGSPGAEAAVRAVAARAWPPHSEVRLVTAVGPFTHLPAVIIDEELTRARALQQAAESELRAAGLEVSTVVKANDPKLVLLDEAGRWGSDCIFVGTRGHSSLARFLLGSVATAVVARAHCSVEVVRAAAA